MKRALVIAGAAVPLLSASVALAEHLKLSELTEPARQTVLREVGTGQITDIEQETEDGTAVYEVEFTAADRDYEIAVTGGGALLRREFD
jgi:hypothetical protein